MKHIDKFVAGLLLPLTIVGMSSCHRFLDVSPSGTLTNDQMFGDINGFHDAMYGVYGLMAQPELYGSNLSYRFVDVIGQQLMIVDPQNGDARMGGYEYTHSDVRPTIDQIWNRQYEAIANANNVIEMAEKSKIDNAELSLIRGEAYALRAFMHFDLLRLFGTDYRTSAPTDRGLPYSNEFSWKNRDVYSLKETYDLIIQDLKMAETLLESDLDEKLYDDVLTADYKRNRYIHMNKWAVKATLARVYNTMGDHAQAAQYAREVITQGPFVLADPSAFRAVRRFSPNDELIFGLYNPFLAEQMRDLFHSTVGSGRSVEGRKDLRKVYETDRAGVGNNDVRFNTYYSLNSGSYVMTRFVESATENVAPTSSLSLKGLSLIRLPEMYYILAESLYDTDRDGAVLAFDTIRKARGLAPLTAIETGSREAFEAALLQEMMKEMPGEGQVFYALKHFNRPFTSFNGAEEIQPSKEIFTLPWPEDEMEFGNK